MVHHAADVLMSRTYKQGQVMSKFNGSIVGAIAMIVLLGSPSRPS